MGCGQGDVPPAYSEVRGVCRLYDISVDNRERKLWREGEPFSLEDAIRFVRERVVTPLAPFVHKRPGHISPP
jgi:hypothetical protein